MENFLLKLYLKLISFDFKSIKTFFKKESPISKTENEMISLIGKNHHYGFLIETIVVKLRLMKATWPTYKYSEKELETLDILINLGDELLLLLEQEDLENHLRSKEYMKKQKQFFNLLNYKLIGLFY